jgi:peptidoglycan hydrolase-like protein with peptidoglycan-binding domain
MKKTFIYIAILAILSPTLAFASFDTNLSYGARSPKVLELQEFLTDQGVYSGPITGNFFSLTLTAVKAFQAKNNISPVSGFFGPLTRAKANDLLEDQLMASNNEVENTGGQIEQVDENTKLVSEIEALKNEIKKQNDKRAEAEKKQEAEEKRLLDIEKAKQEAERKNHEVSFSIAPEYDEIKVKEEDLRGTLNGVSVQAWYGKDDVVSIRLLGPDGEVNVSSIEEAKGSISMPDWQVYGRTFYEIPYKDSTYTLETTVNGEKKSGTVKVFTEKTPREVTSDDYKGYIRSNKSDFHYYSVQ